MKATDPIRATPLTLEDSTPGYRLTGHPHTMGRFVGELDWTLTECSGGHTPGGYWADRVEYVCPVFSSATRENLAEELRKAAELSGVDLVIEPDTETP